MRIDKFLWCIRVFKTRSLAAQQCKLEKVRMNGEICKASRELKTGDVIDVRKGPITFSYQVVSFPKTRVGAKLVVSYSLEVTADEERKKLDIIKAQMKLDRPRGLGRPTKKERRELDEYFFLDEDED
ncbi:MAG: RNA-binding S4 domain-containing protein [Flavobacteriales bacterium]